MFNKPKHRKQRSQHVSNKRLDGSTTCELCQMRPATEWHELRSGKGYRTPCILLGFQLALCRHCHKAWHEKFTKAVKDDIRRNKQLQLMANGLSEKVFRERIGKSWL